jgi:ubiquinol-cytochrome c reductase cytochrome b subunit
LYLWPFLERRVTHDTAEHHLLDRPSDRPMRTAIGVAVLSFYSVLLLAGGQDIWAQKLDVGLSSVLWTFRILLVVLPVLLGWLSWKVCRDLQAGHHSEHEAERAEPPVASNETMAPPPTTRIEPEVTGPA